jgi:hypothetical protein
MLDMAQTEAERTIGADLASAALDGPFSPHRQSRHRSLIGKIGQRCERVRQALFGRL